MRSFKDFRTQYEQIRKIKIEEHAYAAICKAHLFDPEL